jgi:UDP-glucose 6-dehydrogenase
MTQFIKNKTPKVAIVGYGVVGSSYHKLFPDAVVFDPYKNLYGVQVDDNGAAVLPQDADFDNTEQAGKDRVNACDITMVAVFTALNEQNELDTSTVEEVIDWLDTSLILIKSALQPGTVDRLVQKTGKNIAVSVEFIGEGKYPIHFWKYPHQNDPRFHQMLIVGGEEKVAEACAEVLWNKMSPDISIHIVSALEAEITKLVENSYGALKVTFINTLLSLAQKSDANFIKIQQAWQSDPRTDSMHLRAVSFNRGWTSKCWDKDVPALVSYSKKVGAEDTAALFQQVLDLNVEHLKMNEAEE